jgi:hypothetical protein
MTLAAQGVYELLRSAPIPSHKTTVARAVNGMATATFNTLVSAHKTRRVTHNITQKRRKRPPVGRNQLKILSISHLKRCICFILYLSLLFLNFDRAFCGLANDRQKMLAIRRSQDPPNAKSLSMQYAISVWKTWQKTPRQRKRRSSDRMAFTLKLINERFN